MNCTDRIPNGENVGNSDGPFPAVAALNNEKRISRGVPKSAKCTKMSGLPLRIRQVVTPAGRRHRITQGIAAGAADVAIAGEGGGAWRMVDAPIMT